MFGFFEKKQVLSEAGVIYELRVSSQGYLVTLRIVLPPGFPQEAPVITLKQNESDHAIKNPSIDNGGRFHCRSLLEWDGKSPSALAAAVREVVNVLETPEGGCEDVVWRTQHVQDLLRVFPNSRPINPDRSVFDLPIESQGVKITTLRISLPPNFPQERPMLTVMTVISNPAIDNTGRVHCRSLAEWDGQVGRSGLVNAVREAIEVIVTTPAMMFPSQLASAASQGPSAQGLANGGSGQLHSAASAGGPGGGADGSAAPSVLPELQHLSTPELVKLLEDDAHLQRFLTQYVTTLPAARALADVRQRNVSLAAENLDAQASIHEARNHVAIVKSSEYRDAKGTFEDLQRRQEEVLAKLGPAVLLERLQQETKQADGASQVVLDKYFAGTLPLEQFVDEYRRGRTVFHVLDLKRQAASAGELSAA